MQATCPRCFLVVLLPLWPCLADVCCLGGHVRWTIAAPALRARRARSARLVSKEGRKEGTAAAGRRAVRLRFYASLSLLLSFLVLSSHADFELLHLRGWISGYAYLLDSRYHPLAGLVGRDWQQNALLLGKK